MSDVEARWLVEHVSGLDRSQWSEAATADGAARLRALVERRLVGEPLQYVLGRWSFRGLDLIVDPRVLIGNHVRADFFLDRFLRRGVYARFSGSADAL